MELTCTVQTYDWGKRGTESIVANLVKAADDNFTIEENKSYAELWMGSHPNGPSRLKADGKLLMEYIDKNRQVLGTNVDGKSFTDLPFLFKILSVGKALSIQAHPDKKLAEKLYEQQSEIYKDANHKPELAIALSPFEAFCGFRPIHEIKSYMKVLPELRALTGEKEAQDILSADVEFDRNIVKNCLKNILSQDSEIVAAQLNNLIKRISDLGESDRDFLQVKLLERLHKDYPGDVGCFGIYLFNCVSLKPGESIYIAANEPHAYLSGDCVECMACSDNVVRAGLTPKPKDLPTLTTMLTYNCEPASSKRFRSTREDECTEIFCPPVRDFAVAKINIDGEIVSYKLIPRKTASILIIIQGEGEIDSTKIFGKGSVLFVPANEIINFKVLGHPLLMFQAFGNV